MTLPTPTGVKREAETSVDVLDPRTPGHQADVETEGAVLEGQVLLVEAGSHVDDDPIELPEDSYEDLAEDAGEFGMDHPDHWDDARWEEEPRKGKQKELDRLKTYGVFRPVPRHEAVGYKYVTTRWEEVPKFKQGQWIVRSRFVAREFRWQQPHRDDIFGVTSSSNTSRVLDLLLAKNEHYNAYLADVECAFFHAPEPDACCVEPPPEWLAENPGVDWLWILERQLYGRQKAPRLFGDFAAGIIVDKAGFLRCPEVPHIYHHVKEQVTLEVHVDDFYAVGPGNAAGRLLKEIAKHMTMIIEGPYNLENPEFVHLKRKRTITKEGVYIQGSGNHLKKLLELCGLDEKSKPRETPMTKEVVTLEPSEALEGGDIRRFRAIVGVLMYVSTDRPDVQYAVNELAMCMSSPTERALEGAKHLTRYMLGTRDMALLFTRELEGCDDVVVMTDSDWAKDPQTRKSRSAAHIYVGDCLLYSFTRRQSVIAQSSGEAELYATAAGVSEGILIRKVLAFTGMVLGLRTLSDSAANNAMTHRLGVGRVRHLEVKVLWLQQMVYKGLLTMTWQAGKDNNSDLGTKVLTKSRFQDLVHKCGLRVKDGVVNLVKACETGKISAVQAGQLLSVVTMLTQLVGTTGMTTSDEESSGISPLWLILGLVYLIGVLTGWAMSKCLSKKKVASLEHLRLFEAPTSKVLHLEVECSHLKNSKGLKSKDLCKTCAEKFHLKKI